MIKNLLFDLGGVLLTLDRQRSVGRFVRLGVADAPQLLDPYKQNGLFLDAESGRADANEFCEALSRLAGRPISFQEAQHAWLGFVTDVPQYKLDYLLELQQRGYGVDILSNTNPFIMEWARSHHFSAAGRPLTAYVRHIYASYELQAVKPEPALFAEVLRRGAYVPEETLFIDDGAANVAAARRLGLQTLETTNGADFRPAIEALLNQTSGRPS